MLVIGCGLVFSVVVVIYFFFFSVSMVVVGLVGWLFFVFSIQGCFNVGGGFFFFFFLRFNVVPIAVVMVGFRWLG